MAAALAVTTAAVAATAPPAAAAGTPGITLSVGAPGSVLSGGTVPITLTAANPASNPGAVPEYNLSFTTLLPAGLTYVAGSSSPSSAGEPTVSTNVATGQQTLVWRNVSDLQVADSFALSFRALSDPAVLPVGAQFAVVGGAYASTDPRKVPAFTAAGAPVAGSYTESATASTGVTTLSALEVTKAEPSPEAELLRGVHDHVTTYTLTVTNTSVASSTGVVLTDYLPANLELLLCGGVDNSAAPEYAGAPSLSATPVLSPCVTPASVSTVLNPPAQGTTVYPPGVYTRIQWNLGTLAAGATTVIRYRAGIPLRANTMSFGGSTPTPASLQQASNLDNNTGASTRETATEASATNTARVTGTYTGPLAPGGSSAAAADTTHTVSVEDVRMRKTASTSQFATAGRVQYTLTIDTSEYVAANGIAITDVIPDGLCPLGGVGTNYTPGTPSECAGSAGTAPSSPISSVTANANGTFTVVFSPLGPVAADGTTTLTYWAGMRTNYGGGDPTSNGDSFTNTASLTATTTPIPGTGETGAQTVTDTSSSTIGTGDLTLDKTIGPRSMAGVCGTDGTGYGEPSSFAPSETKFGKGDVVCFKLRIDFDTLTKTRNPVVTDFLPVGTEYVAGSAVATTNDQRAPAVLATTADSLTWTLGTAAGSGAKYVDLGAVFEWVLAVRVTDAAPVGSPDILGNSMKLRTEDSAGRGRSYRDEVDFTIVPAAPLRVVKGVLSVSSPAAGPNGLNSDVDGLPVREGSVVRFRIDLTNDGSAATSTNYSVGGVDLWDVLPEHVRCVDVGNITGIASIPATPVIRCTDPGDPNQPSFALNGSRSAIRWTYALDTSANLAAQGLAPGASWTYTYDMTVPSPTAAGFTFTNTAAVRSYSALTNLPASGAGATTTYFPQSNIDTSLPVDQQDAPAASDISSVITPKVAVGKVGTTSITEANNNAANQATIGELITYRYAVTIPAGTSVFDGSLTDALPTGFVLTTPTPTVEFCPSAPTPTVPDPLPACASPGALPVGVSLNTVTGALTVGGIYDNSTAVPQRFLVTATARVTGAALTTAQNNVNRVNTARFDGDDRFGGQPLTAVTATYTVNVRQPNPAIVKTNDRPGTVIGGQLVTYTVAVTNQNSASSITNRPPLHDAFVVDCLPSGLTFAAYGANPGLTPVAGDGTNGCAVGTTRLVWALGSVPASLTATTRTYTATINLSAVGGDTYTNTARLTGGTLNDGKPAFDSPDNPDERVYSVTAPSTVVVGGNGLVKSVDEPIRTIGQVATYTVSALVPSNTTFYDAALLDTTPAGLSAPSVQSTSCVIVSTGNPCPGFTVTTLTPAAAPGGATKYGWGIGDLLGSPDQRRISITYTQTVTDVPTNTAGNALTNTALSVWFSTDGNNPTSVTAPFDRSGFADTETVTVVEPSLSITKAVSDTTPDPGQPFDYTLTVRNATGATVSDAFNTVVTDVVPLGVVVDVVDNGGVLTGADPVRGGGTITWSAAGLPGPLAPGATYSLGYSAHLAPSPTITAAPLTNTASVTRYEGLPSGGRVYAGPSTTAVVTPQFPTLVTAKAATDGAPAYLGTPYTWTITVTNTGNGPGFAIGTTDDLPPNWTYDTGTAQVRLAGGPAVAQEPTVLTSGAQKRLVWTDLGDLLPGQSLTITYRSTPQAAVVTNPGVGASVAQTNTAVADGLDATDEPGNASGQYGNRPGSAVTRIDSADVRIVKSHSGSPVAGATFTWSLAVSNAGPDRAVGPFVVTDTIQSPQTLVSASGTGWSCSVVGQALSCQRTNGADTLASGASFPVISVRVTTPDTTAAGTVLTNTADVSARTYDPQLPNNTSTDTATVTTAADLAVTKSHSGPAIAGQDITWTVDVVNNGPSVSLGPITVVDTLPTGSILVSATGTGWLCTPGSGTVSCVRAADLAPGAAAPQISVVTTIPTGQTGSITNTAVVSGTTTDPVPGNNTGTDTVAVSALADLSIAKTSIGAVVAGADATYELEVRNLGPSVSRGPIRVTDTLPAGTTLVSASGTGWTCVPGSGSVTCTRAADLAAGAVAPVITVVASVPPGALGTIVNTATVTATTTDPNPGNNTDTDTSTLDTLADLAIVKSHTGSATAGAQFTWSLDVTNKGPSDSPGTITVTDALPAGTSFVSATGTGWVCSAAADVVTCDRAATLSSLAAAPTISVVVLVDASYGPSFLVNDASVDGPLNDPDPSNNADLDTVPVVDRADLAITKTTSGANPVAAGAATQFSLLVENLGPSTADSVVVSDTLPAGITYVSSSSTGWSCSVAGQDLECTRPSMTPGSSTITIDVTVGSGVAAGSTITNTATVSTSTPGDDPANDASSSTVSVVGSADLVLDKSHDAAFDTVVAGTQAEFRVEVRNAGPSDAQPDVVVTDTLPAGLTYLSSTGPWTCVPGTVTPAGQDVVCTATSGTALAAGASEGRLTLLVAVDASADSGTFTNSATVVSGTTDPVPGNNTDTDAITVTRLADLSVTKSHAGAVRVGDDLSFTLTVANAGPSEARDVVLTDTLPTGLTFVSATGAGWTCGAVGAVVTCALGTPLAPGATAPPVTVTATVEASAYPSAVNTATVDGSTLDPDPTNNTATDTVNVPPLVNLAITKAHTGTLQVGTPATYTLVVTNDGPTDDPGPITITDPLPAGLSFVSGSGTGWTCSASGQDVTCELTAGLATGSSTTLALVVDVLAAAYPSVTNIATVSTPSEETTLADNTATDPAVVNPLVDLGITKSLGSYDKGSRLATWVITVTNHGPNESTAPIVVSDTLPSTLVYQSAGGTGWTCALGGQTVTCTRVGDLPVGASSSFTVATWVNAPAGTTVVNTAEIDGGDPNTDNNKGTGELPLPDTGGLSPTGADAQLLLIGLGLLAIGLLALMASRRRAPQED